MMRMSISSGVGQALTVSSMRLVQSASVGKFQDMREFFAMQETDEWAKNAVYGPAGQLTALSWVVEAGSNLASDVFINEGRTYNSRLQLTGLTTTGSFTQAAMNFTYNYSATANNGQITSMTNNVSGETVTYAYDALKRLIGASTNTGTWGQSFAYDGFGNMLNQTVTQGTAPSLTLAYDNATNRITTAGYGYDANGNMTASPAFGATYTYDASNRLVTAFSSNGTENYGYAPDNKRIYKKLASGEEQVHFYSGNRRLGIYKFQVDGGGIWSFATVSTQKYFGGRKLETMDRLGSDVRNTKYFPYGAETTVTANERDKFGTYFRDTASNLDYADQRYYSSVIGRFMTADPSAPGDPADPGSWNFYAYVQGDPTNFNDPDGLQACGALLGFGTGGQTLGDLIEGDDDAALLGRLVWAESSGSVFAANYIQEKTAVAVSVVNRWKIDNGLIFVIGARGSYLPTSFGGTTYKSIIGATGQYQAVTSGPDPQLTPGFQKALDKILGDDIGVGRQVGITDPSNGQLYSINESCFNLIQSFVAGNLGVNGKLIDPFASQGVTVSFNLGNVNPNRATMTGFGNVGRGAPTYFFGYANTTTTPPLPKRRGDQGGNGGRGR